MRKAFSSLAVATAALLILSLGGPPALADPTNGNTAIQRPSVQSLRPIAATPDPPTPDELEERYKSAPFQDEEEALAHDAAATGLTLEQARWVNEFNLAMTAAYVAYPDDFAVAIMDAKTSTGRVLFKDDAPEGALETFGGVSGIHIEAYVGYNENDLNDDVLAVMDALRERFPETPSIVASADVKSGIISAAVEEFDGPIDTNQVEADLNVTTRLRSKFDISVENMREPAFTPEAFDGGWLIQHNTIGLCTTSFPVAKNNSSAIGFLTAGHCPGTGAYGGVSDAFFPPMNKSLHTTDQFPGGDMRWNWSKVFLTGRTFIGTGTRAFASAGYASIDTPVCKYGWKTEDGCSYVEALNVYYDDVTPGGHPDLRFRVGPLTQVRSWITDRGDSGGPWFYGNVAYGIHSGSPAKPGSSVRASAFTKILNALWRLDVQLIY